ncbi:MAG: GNAT family N-acetyltransferase [Acidobacteria bacterium]|nr:MAG: GNAT family N-acetyltransferase [Acidobacteriota bacterium]RPJ83444.1 MAG: GNAT family N-acetyltransferase [Acidobacteriota bacterium]
MENAGELVTFRSLDSSVADECEAMTFPLFRHLLLLYPAPRYPTDGDRRNVQPIGTVAFAGNHVVGLALAAIPVDSREEAELLSLFVNPHWRQHGIASELIRRLEDELRGMGVARVEATYMTGKPSIAIVERLLAGCGWDPPVVRTVTVRFTPEEARATPWFGRKLLPRGAEVFEWARVTAEEMERLKASNDASPWIAEGLEPWAHSAMGFDAASSLGLRLGDDIAGWVINHRIWADTLRFTCSFMRADLARRAAILPLYTESIARAEAAGYRQCTFITPVKYAGMVDFVVNRCAKWVSYVGETRGVAKRL